MNLTEIVKQLDRFKEGLTEQRWTMDDYIFKNEYITVLRIDTSNRKGGEKVKQGKQWSIIFERTTNLILENLSTYIELVRRTGFIKVTRRVNHPGHYGIRFYHMAKNPDIEILDNIMDYLFSR